MMFMIENKSSIDNKILNVTSVICGIFRILEVGIAIRR